MSTFSESNLRFSFPEDWIVIKSDEHRFYRYLSGVGLKGVDFIAIVDHHLLLIEVKNYADRFPQDNSLPSTAILNEPLHYAEVFAQKFSDSLQLIRVIHQHYQRKIWFTFFLPLLHFLPKNWIKTTDWYFWPKAYEIVAKDPTKVKLWIWLEMGPEVTKSEKETLFKKLKLHFDQYHTDKTFQIEITNQLNKIDNWGVTATTITSSKEQ